MVSIISSIFLLNFLVQLDYVSRRSKIEVAAAAK